MKPRTSGLVTAMMLATALSCVVTGQPPTAGQSDPPGSASRHPAFQALDTDRDGVIASAEIDGAAESLISLDTDRDGQISGGELRPPRGMFFGGLGDIPEGTRIVTLDTRSGDGTVDLSALPPQFQEALAGADMDGDGKATVADILGLMATQGGTPSSGGQQSSPLVTALDADADGTISAAEIASAPQSLRTLDNDGDRTLSSSELLPAPAGLPE